ncbi:PAS domain S-box protein [Salinadaptatus halalkaliphilus]|uniref:histidine kinase n=1 Tax=Salinadaptatus halalkaliphilus TaxID=2419781 RepID=A0A4S3TIF1_9EURY|nr:ATP-binding protein [Salinadaptatus halalkaliphilus]THE63834.1 PAS domain S-box protein [Salinadaptatus halalkaliphilus]
MGEHSINVLAVDDTGPLTLPSDDQYQFTVETTATADGVLEYLAGERSTVDCVVSRNELPGMGGLELLAAIRDRYPELPFVLRIEPGSESAAETAIEYDATEYHLHDSADDRNVLLANRIQTLVENYRSRRGLERRNIRLETLIDNLPGMVYRCRNEPGWPMEYIEGDCEQITGYAAGTFESGAVSIGHDLVHPDDREAIWEITQAALENREAFEETYRIETADGETKWLWERGRGVYTDGGDIEALEGFITDVTHRREQERKRRRNQRRFEAVFEDPQMLVGLLDPDGTVLQVNGTAMEYVDVDRDRIVGEPFWETPWWADDARDSVRKWVEQAATGEYVNYESDHERPDGESRRISGTVRPVTNEGDEPTSLVVTGHDVTDRRDQYERLVETRDKLAVLNQVVRHDLRNHMQVVRGRGRLLDDHVEPAGETHLEEIILSADEAIDLTETARDLTETVFASDDTELRSISVQDVVGSAVDSARSRYEETAITVYGLGTDVTVQADGMLESVVHNLVQNAIVHNDADLAEIDVAVDHDEDSVLVSVADNGPGIADERKDAVFGRGEKGLESPGTGIGLYLVRTLVEQYGGDVWIDDNDPRGSIVCVELPTVDDPS